jgi:hypothetical protein
VRTGRQGDRETETEGQRQRDRETERRRDGEKERRRDREGMWGTQETTIKRYRDRFTDADAQTHIDLHHTRQIEKERQTDRQRPMIA